MPTCLNCGYELVLLSNRLKYKCSLCSKLYPQKEIDNQTFRIWNKKQKELDTQNYEVEYKEELAQLKQLKKSIKQLFKNLLPSREILRQKEREYRVKNRDKYNETKRNYWDKRAEYLNAKRQERYNVKKEQVLSYQKQWQQNNSYKYRMKRRLADLREQQRCLALKQFKNKEYRLYTIEFQKVLPTFLLSYLLMA